MKNLIMIFICVALSGSAIGQTLTVEYIDNWIKLCEPELDLSKKEMLYLIEGVPYDKPKEELSEFDTSNKYFSLDYLNSDSAASVCLKPNHIVVFIQNAQTENLKQRKKDLENAQNRFKDQYTFHSHHVMTEAKDPALFINDIRVHHAEAKKKLSELKAKEVQHLVSVKHAPAIYYGQNAENGLVKIWTK
ncbi:MAG: hypothetical protein ABJF11_13440 [Reichenbachiella sp.]|uniref:hypothetical protein n=1 Tax=Reichenbachiella sp. TaxID=2184521 RepID=UPI003266A42B